MTPGVELVGGALLHLLQQLGDGAEGGDVEEGGVGVGVVVRDLCLNVAGVENRRQALKHVVHKLKVEGCAQ